MAMSLWHHVGLVGLGMSLACEEPAAIEPIDVEPSSCGHALLVANSDYQSTSLSMMGFDGRALARDIVNSGSAVPGLSAALSGDVVFASQEADSVVWIDRSSASVAWYRPKEASIAQLSVRTGFASNPQDALVLSQNKAYVSRLEDNPNPGRSSFDRGSDVLVVDPARRIITGSIDLSLAVPAQVQPRPGRMLVRGESALVLLAALSDSFDTSEDSRLVLLDIATDSVTTIISLVGARNCLGLALSPSQNLVAVSCTGTFAGMTAKLDESFVIVLDATQSYQEVARVPAAFGRPFSFAIAFASEAQLLAPSFGSIEPPIAQDALLAIDWSAGSSRVLRESDPFHLGDVRCLCERCYVTNASMKGLEVFELDNNGQLQAGPTTDKTSALGLPARGLGHWR